MGQDLIIAYLIGGPGDGAHIAVPHDTQQLCMPKDHNDQHSIPLDEAQFNVSMHGSPLKAGTEYEMYKMTGSTKIFDNDGLPVKVWCYKYVGVVKK